MNVIEVREFGDPGVLQPAQREVPAPEHDEVLLEVEAIGVNPVDTYVRAGTYPVLPELPYVPGKDVAGRIIEVGDSVKRWRQGDRVYSAGTRSGGYAQYAVCHQSQVFSLPENMDFAAGAAVGVPGAAAWRALFTRARARERERVLVHGASGSVGMIVVQLAISRGLEVYGTAGTARGIEQVERTGVRRVYDHCDPGYLAAIREDIGEKGFDVIVEMLANVNLVSDLELLGRKGRVVIVGSRGTIAIDPRATMAKETEILGMSLFNSTEDEMKEAHIGLYRLMCERRLAPPVACTLRLEQAALAHEKIAAGGNCGKIVLLP